MSYHGYGLESMDMSVTPLVSPIASPTISPRKTKSPQRRTQSILELDIALRNDDDTDEDLPTIAPTVLQAPAVPPRRILKGRRMTPEEREIARRRIVSAPRTTKKASAQSAPSGSAPESFNFKGGRRKSARRSPRLRSKQKSKSPRRRSRRRSSCVRQTTKKYTTRPSPPYPANACCGKVMMGNDGKRYRSTPNKNGVCAWHRV